MNTLPRRSARLQQQYQQQSLQQNGYNQFASYQNSSSSSSTTASSRPSPFSDSLIFAEQQQQQQFDFSFLAPPQGFAAPLPSPSAGQINPFFGRIGYDQFSNQQMGGQEQLQQQGQSTDQAQQSRPQGQTQQQQPNHTQHHNSFSAQGQPARRDFAPTSNNGQPPGLPTDFLAEAAKRAQMACLMRDIDDISL